MWSVLAHLAWAFVLELAKRLAERTAGVIARARAVRAAVSTRRRNRKGAGG